jgi:lysylphosphatidylglycerol synthetase-like protein (DUF2156 family)
MSEFTQDRWYEIVKLWEGGKRKGLSIGLYRMAKEATKGIEERLTHQMRANGTLTSTAPEAVS